MKANLNHSPAMNAYGGVEVQLHSFLTSVLVGVTSQFQALVVYPQVRSLRYPMNRLVGPQIWYWSFDEEKNLFRMPGIWGRCTEACKKNPRNVWANVHQMLLEVIWKDMRFAAQGMGVGSTKPYPQIYSHTSPSSCHSPLPTQPLPVTQTTFFTAREAVLTTFVRSTGIRQRGLK